MQSSSPPLSRKYLSPHPLLPPLLADSIGFGLVFNNTFQHKGLKKNRDAFRSQLYQERIKETERKTPSLESEVGFQKGPQTFISVGY